ncbi:phosphoribosyl-ATP pyrophosphatase [Chryseobacterium sp. CBo1]|uniref:phosphoribosyl-ATP pyrophosphatase n=1 Tax=unclassified Chryseobacterium TaxID=2593645 RepID=UPI0008107C32|nr:phosphoribosyl-ATP pyrophosphatase [Chryseobacterium sp. CBo1]OCK49929.1 phosphoribosyl-ATP pyrophosphatase [Chryseobacterium sp. CBo1]
MGRNYESLEELKRKKRLLKGEIKDLEALLTFKNTKESLSAFTNGLSDQYLQEKVDEDGEEKTVIRKDVIAKQLTSEVKDMLLSKNAAVGLASSAFSGNAVDGLIKLGVTALVANYAKKNMKSSNWKKKLLGAALIYVAPIALKYVRKKLENYQKTKSVSSMEQLI